jgi:cytochrome P450
MSWDWLLDTDFHCCQQLRLTEVASAFEFLSQEYTRRIVTPWDPSSWLYSLPTAANREHQKQREIIRTFIAQQITATRAQLSSQDGTVTKQNLLANLLRVTKMETGQQDTMTDEAIGDVLMTLLFGGHDTTSIALSYALYLLAKHPHSKAACLEEIQSVLPKDDDDYAIETPDQLPYTRAIIMETLRLFPPIPTTSRNLERPMELSGHVLPTGTNIFIPIWSIQRDERNFPRPTEFLPERWVRRTEKGWQPRGDDTMGDSDAVVPPANQDAFCVFAAGARNCVGRNLAIQEAVTLLALLIRKVDFQLIDPDYRVQPTLASVVQQPGDGLPMILTRRD